MLEILAQAQSEASSWWYFLGGSVPSLGVVITWLWRVVRKTTNWIAEVDSKLEENTRAHKDLQDSINHIDKILYKHNLNGRGAH